MTENGSRIRSPLGFDHITFYVGNAKQAAFWYCSCFGFEPFGIRNLETGSRKIASHAVRQGKIILVFEAPLIPNLKEHTSFHSSHGDAVQNVAFEVDNLDELITQAVAKGAKIVQGITEETDENGTIRYASLHAFGDVIHTVVDRQNYSGFWPGFKPSNLPVCHLSKFSQPNFENIDHFVGAQPELEINSVVEWYQQILHFHKFWTESNAIVASSKSSLTANYAANDDASIKVVVAEGRQEEGQGVSQIKEFVDYNGGSGVQHIAFSTSNIISTVEALEERGVELLDIPESYYELVRKRLEKSTIKIAEDIKRLEELKIFIDFDDQGYLLQKFTKPLDDRPTLFIEIIERHNYNGFGAGNFKAIFEAIEKLQEKRDTL